MHVNGIPAEHSEFSEAEVKQLKSDLERKFLPYHLRVFNTKTGDFEHKIITQEDAHYTRNFSSRIVPEGKYFVMGDNRDFSADSRMWGWVDHRLIKGKALFVWFSLSPPNSQMGHEFKFRPWRIGRGIH